MRTRPVHSQPAPPRFRESQRRPKTTHDSSHDKTSSVKRTRFEEGEEPAEPPKKKRKQFSADWASLPPDIARMIFAITDIEIDVNSVCRPWNKSCNHMYAALLEQVQAGLGRSRFESLCQEALADLPMEAAISERKTFMLLTHAQRRKLKACIDSESLKAFDDGIKTLSRAEAFIYVENWIARYNLLVMCASLSGSLHAWIRTLALKALSEIGQLNFDIMPAAKEIEELLLGDDSSSMALNQSGLADVPDHIALFPELTHLNLAHNCIHWPHHLEMLPHLKNLSLNNTGVSPKWKLALPAGSKNTTLKAINLSNNALKQFPDCLYQLETVNTVCLANNALPSLPPSITQLTSLQKLNLNNNHLAELPEEITTMQGLLVLLVAKNLLKTLPKNLHVLSHLRELNIDGNQLEEIPVGIIKLPRLKSLNIAGNPLKKIPVELIQSPSLERLTISKDQVHLLPSNCELRFFDTQQQLQTPSDSYSSFEEVTVDYEEQTLDEIKEGSDEIWQAASDENSYDSFETEDSSKPPEKLVIFISD